ncbi:hypothetical protein [Quadrisphaera sp. DSM 44207]|nr:hypothetical protein [Quadrisphaera sp. DSM 44207]
MTLTIGVEGAQPQDVPVQVFADAFDRYAPYLEVPASTAPADVD